jgi:Flp pilus assembly protein CpaB
MDGKTLIILILSIALSGILGYLFSQRRTRKMFKKRVGGMKKKRDAMKKKKEPVIKPEGAAKGEPAESQSGVAQYAIENGL